jgi:hypothetical protein
MNKNKRFYWDGFSNCDRHQAISDVTSIIGKYGAILNFQRFSDLAMGISIEVEENVVDNLLASLREKIGVTTKEQTINPLSGKECLVMLNLTFIRGTGELEIENPGITE